MNKFETRTQVLLNILLDDINEMINLSRGRMTFLSKQGSVASIEAESSMLVDYAKEKEHIKTLLELNKNTYSNAPFIVNLSFRNDDGELNSESKTYESEALN